MNEIKSTAEAIEALRRIVAFINTLESSENSDEVNAAIDAADNACYELGNALDTMDSMQLGWSQDDKDDMK